MNRTPSFRTHFLISQGWEPVEERATKRSPPITMWRDPVFAIGRGGWLERRVMWPREAEYLADRRVHLVRSVMED